MISAGVVPGVGFFPAASSLVAGSQVGGSDCGGAMVRLCRVSTCGMVVGVARVREKNPSSPDEVLKRRESVGMGV